jgi:eukaryotic-like serine/threonine-protein kinase
VSYALRERGYLIVLGLRLANLAMPDSVKTNDSNLPLLRLKELFAAVCDLPRETDADRRVLAQSIAALNATEDERIALCRLLDKDSHVLTPTNPVSAMLTSIKSEASVSRTGMRLGAWTLHEKIGEGGMGTVYRALRSDGQFQQTVAIKFLSGFSTAAAAERLVAERHTLAALEHPNIARLIDGGTAADAKPYIVMDFVDGLDIGAHCRNVQANLKDIVGLMVSVVEAVAYAHQKLILHCDLKPANILVDRQHRVKLLDFGIAEIVSRADANKVAGEAQLPRESVFTPRYASPEQRARQPLSTATDIYSLGIVLRELVEAISPTTPITSIASPKKSLGMREVSAIINRATQLDSRARYRSAGDMRADLIRLLSLQPVSAMQGSLLYSTQKLFMRRWPVVIAISALLLGAIGFTHGLVRERDRALRAENMAATELTRALAAEDLARAERDRAQVSELRATQRELEAVEARKAAINGRDRALVAEAFSRAETLRALRAETKTQIEIANTREARDFLFSLFDGADPNLGGSPKMSANDLLARGRDRITKLPPEQAEFKSSLMFVLGRIHENIGLNNEAKSLYREVIAMESRLDTGDASQLAAVLGRLAIAESNTDNAAAGEASARQSLAIRQATPLADARMRQLLIADAQNTLGVVLNGLSRQDEARVLLTDALNTREALLGTNSEEVASTLHNLGINLSRSNQDSQQRAGEDHYRRSLAIKYQIFGKRHPKTLNTIVALANLLGRRRQFNEAEPLLAEAHQTRLLLHGEASEQVAAAANDWASVLHDMGRYRDAEARYVEAINNPARLADASGRRPVSYAVSVNNLATLYEETGDLVRAEEYYRLSYAARAARLAADDLAIARIEHNLGRLLLKRGNRIEAETLLNRAYNTRLAKLGPTHIDTQESRISLVGIDIEMAAMARANTRLQDVDLNIIARRKTSHLAYLRLRATLTEPSMTNNATPNWTPAIDIWRSRVAIATTEFGATHIFTLRTQLDLANAVARAGMSAEASTLARMLAQQLTPRLALNALEHANIAALIAQTSTGAAP